jgi:hypothetical protein
MSLIGASEPTLRSDHALLGDCSHSVTAELHSAKRKDNSRNTPSSE